MLSQRAFLSSPLPWSFYKFEKSKFYRSAFGLCSQTCWEQAKLNSCTLKGSLCSGASIHSLHNSLLSFMGLLSWQIHDCLISVEIMWNNIARSRKATCKNLFAVIFHMRKCWITLGTRGKSLFIPLHTHHCSGTQSGVSDSPILMDITLSH